ncbi:MAG: hypothetical protein ACLTC3_10215 [Evtepia gabavorous]
MEIGTAKAEMKMIFRLLLHNIGIEVALWNNYAETAKVKKVESVLRMNHLVCDELSFERLGFKHNAETRYDFSYGIGKDGDGAYRAVLTIEANREGEFKAKVQMTGYFSIDEDNPQREFYYKKMQSQLFFHMLAPR